MTHPDLYNPDVEKAWSTDESKEFSRIDLLLDGTLQEIDFRGFTVYSPESDDIIYFADDEGRCHGEMMVKGEPTLPVHDWLVRKANRYGKN
jgi:hypothetical protein